MQILCIFSPSCTSSLKVQPNSSSPLNHSEFWKSKSKVSFSHESNPFPAKLPAALTAATEETAQKLWTSIPGWLSWHPLHPFTLSCLPSALSNDSSVFAYQACAATDLKSIRLTRWRKLMLSPCEQLLRSKVVKQWQEACFPYTLPAVVQSSIFTTPLSHRM